MAISKDSHSQLENKILAALPAEEYNRLAPHLVPVRLNFYEILKDIDEPIDYVYFPNSGVVSILSLTEEGTVLQVAMIGNEGVVDISALLGATTTPYQAIVQIQGIAMKMNMNILKEEFMRLSSLTDLLLHYIYTLIIQLTQSSVCNRFHTVKQRLCHWLLVTQDRINAKEFKLTHDLLSQMLGTRRAAITVAIGDLQRDGVVHYTRGRITLLDRAALEATSCSCYKVVKDVYNRTGRA